ncbi:MAG: DEAD/DEAH box helicase family protein [Smithella sp.]
MKFQFKIQSYQTDAVNSVVDVFAGQPYQSGLQYTRDLGIKEKPKTMPVEAMPLDFSEYAAGADEDMDDATGFANGALVLRDEQLLANIRSLQLGNNIKQSVELVKDIGRCSLDVEMETGTGKTYVYSKTIFELNKKYGWSKFIVVVPSIAIHGVSVKASA